MTFLTTGDISKQLRVPLFRVAYAIAKSGIRERSRGGGVRLFDRNQLPAIQAVLHAVRVGKVNGPDDN